MNRNGKIVVVLALIATLATGCGFFNSNLNKYAVRVRFSGAANDETMQNVSAVVGAEKYWWPSISSNEEKSVSLFSDKSARNSVTLLYTIGGTKRSWESAVFAKQDTGYEVILTVNASGEVTERTCITVCR